MLFTPLEQFEIISLIPIKFGWLNISFTNSSLFILLVFGVILLLVHLSTLNSTIIPNRWQSVFELMYEFILSLLDENVGSKGQKYFPFIFVVFIFILFCNLIGMIPYSFTVTSHIIVTFGLAFSIWFGITIIGFMHHGIHFFSFFMPPGAPLALAPLLVVIELVSYLFRSLSLSIRLFANMMAGHTLLKIMSGFAWTMFGIGGIFYIVGLLPILLLFAFIALEIGVAMLQAYVFTILICIYLNDSINLH